MDGLDQTDTTTNHFSPDRLTGHIDPFNHQRGKGDSGYSSFSISFNTPEYLSVAHCSEDPRQSGYALYRGPDSETLQHTDAVVCDAGVMSTEERAVFPPMDNPSRNGNNRKFNWSNPPPPPIRHDSFLVTKQHNGLGNNYSYDELCLPNVAERSSLIESKTRGMTNRSYLQSKETTNLPAGKVTYDLGQTRTPWCTPTSNLTGFVPERHSQSLEGAVNFPSKGTDKASQNDSNDSLPPFVHYSLGVTHDCAESQQQINNLPLAHGIKPHPIRQQHLDLSPVVTLTSASESNQTAVSYCYTSSTHTETSIREPWPAEGISGPIQAKDQENTTEAYKSEAHSKPHVTGDCKGRKESLNPLSTSHLVLQSPAMDLQSTCGEFGFRRHNNASSSQIFYCGPSENSHNSKLHPTVPESAIQSKYLSQRQMRNSIDSAESQILPHSDARTNHNALANQLSTTARQLCTDGIITAENTPMLHRLTFESINTAKNAAGNTNQKIQATEDSKEAYNQRNRNQDLRKGFQSKQEQFHKCKSFLQLLDEPTKLNQLNEESSDLLGTPIVSSKIAYRDQVKYAQTMVLRETSFKRRDLQLSWPNRAKQKPTERPSITHLQTASLTDPRHFLDDPTTTMSSSQVLHEDLPAKSLASEHQAAHMGSRKRLTSQEKTMYHSVPEKINQLGVTNGSRKFPPSWEQDDNFPNPHEERSIVASMRQLFETTSLAANAPMALKHIQHKALIEYMERKKSQRPRSTEPMCEQSQMGRFTSHRRFSDWSSNVCSNLSPAKGQNISRHKSADVLWEPWDDSLAMPAICTNTSPSSQLSQPFQNHHFQKRADDVSFSGKFASTDKLPNQPRSVHFVGRPRSKSSPLSSQKDLAPAVSSEPMKQMCNSRNTSRSVSGKINPVTDRISYSNCHENKRKNMAPSKNILARQRGKSLDEIQTPRVRSSAVLSRSSDQLHHSAIDSEVDSQTGNMVPQEKPSGSPTKWIKVALALKKERPPLSRLPSPKQEGIKLKQEGIMLGTNKISALTTFETNSKVIKAHRGSSAESPTSTSPSPRSRLQSPLWNSRDRAHSLSSLSSWRDDVFVEDSSNISKNSTTDPCSAAENFSVQFNISQQHHSKSFESSPTEITMNKETKSATQSTRGKNSLSTKESLHLDLGENGEENHNRSMSTVLGSSSNSSDVAIERPVPILMAQVAKSAEDKSETSQPFPVKDHQDNGEEPFQQLSKDPGSTSVHVRVKTKTPEDLRIEELIKEIINEDHSLADVLDPSPTRKTIMDLVTELFQKDTSVLEACQRRKQMDSQAMMKETKNKNKQDNQLSFSIKTNLQSEISMKINQKQESTKSEMECESDVTEKKELINTIKCKLQKLQEAKSGLNEDIKRNSTLGDDIQVWVNEVCTPNEVQKYKTFIEDLDKVMNLLLCLSSRLVRVESALSKVNEATDVEEKQSLNERHRTLSRQREDARGLKEHQDHRERVIFSILTNYLTKEQLLHCEHFIQMRKAFLIKQKELEEDCKLTEEQLEFFENTLQI
ncbi:protein Shroom1-like isoform X2 [Stegostoma tigrinum]|uniref:protein Shroom1-like isoform X2 n=1 Tax=Stegostoma tigrinum TaxID=3053191 RepID=UPI00202B2739|nr:protein Shroom1-like isoform X2 [Stegostoma tigrinum]